MTCELCTGAPAAFHFQPPVKHKKQSQFSQTQETIPIRCGREGNYVPASPQCTCLRINIAFMRSSSKDLLCFKPRILGKNGVGYRSFGSERPKPKTPLKLGLFEPGLELLLNFVHFVSSVKSSLHNSALLQRHQLFEIFTQPNVTVDSITTVAPNHCTDK